MKRGLSLTLRPALRDRAAELLERERSRVRARFRLWRSIWAAQRRAGK